MGSRNQSNAQSQQGPVDKQAIKANFGSILMDNIKQQVQNIQGKQVIEQEQKQSVDVSKIGGRWCRNLQKTKVEELEGCFDILQLHGIKRKTARAINDMEVEFNKFENQLAVKYITPLPFYKVTEKYEIGQTVDLRRRDLKKGKQTASVHPLKDGFQVESTWGVPREGQLKEVFKIVSDNELHVTCTIKIGQESAKTHVIYDRQNDKETNKELKKEMKMEKKMQKKKEKQDRKQNKNNKQAKSETES